MNQESYLEISEILIDKSTTPQNATAITWNIKSMCNGSGRMAGLAIRPTKGLNALTQSAVEKILCNKNKYLAN